MEQLAFLALSEITLRWIALALFLLTMVAFAAYSVGTKWYKPTRCPRCNGRIPEEAQRCPRCGWSDAGVPYWMTKKDAGKSKRDPFGRY